MGIEWDDETAKDVNATMLEVGICRSEAPMLGSVTRSGSGRSRFRKAGFAPKEGRGGEGPVPVEC